jgi:hypothetical protein
LAIIRTSTNQVPVSPATQDMVARLLATLVKVAVASLIVGTILQHFGITAEKILADVGITPERLMELARQGLAWALPNVLLGSMIIVPVWLVVFLFRPPGTRSE